MKLLRLELKKTDIKSNCFAAFAIFVCLLGLTYIFAWVPSLGTADPNAVELFSTYSGIAAMDGAVGLMAFSALASTMGYRYVIKEYSGANAITGRMFSLVNDNLQFIDIALAYRNALVLACLTDGIALCSLRIGFIKKSNSMTVISAILLSMLLVNLASDINQSFTMALGLSAVIFVIGLLLTFNMVRKVERMEI